MRFAYVAIGAAGFLTATMIGGRVILAPEASLRSTFFQSRSIDPYTNQQTSGNTPHATQAPAMPSTGRGTTRSDLSNTSSTPSAVENQPYATNDQQAQVPVPAEEPSAANPATNHSNDSVTSPVSRPASQGQSNPPMAVSETPTGSNYAEGQNGGPNAGAHNHNSSDDNSQPAALTNFSTPDAPLNQGYQAGPQTGVIQHSSHHHGSNETHDGEFMKGQPEDSQAAHPPHMQGGQETDEKAIPPPVEGNQHSNEPSQAGPESGVNQSTNARQPVDGQNGSQAYNGAQVGIGESGSPNAQVGSGQPIVSSTFNVSGGAKDEVLSSFSQVDDDDHHHHQDTY
ncbi:hypothetical protein CROQUDRAFT_718764 [Cronartium quercuum f. sp. fusiforme G11]|uniref:Uncharacterized protein n=1 Tax=Cronartium quercuum f. sp. fusiforme G11 TaxID=708437 RepID=A0A9P6N715_9BASI|nr:hypothetical protein CROQUDRAFT_718764 [Cronartium quercuum f. sp. fusiforme G11]